MAEQQTPPTRNGGENGDDEGRSLLIVEDNDRFADTLASEFRDRGYLVERARDLAGIEAIPDLDTQFAVVDLRLGADSGLDAIQSILARSPDARIVVLTGYGSIATAVKATKLGAIGYLMKPSDVDQIERVLLDGDDIDTELPIPDEFQSLYRHEREYIEFVLAECDGNISQAARRLGLHRQSLQRKLRKYTPQ
ncbi:MAG: response regulator [Deltaproteobacteria bacterium]|jgi:two-component system response regulator RegA|nr:response regulator [Deltaproteobacteria bacterium]MBW2496088.1 response regulator [Deltaproteobacteria bacterium]